MSEHILVPLDGSSSAENAVPYAAKLAKILDLPLRFVHVAEGGESSGDPSRSSEAFAEHARELVERFEFDDREFTSLVREGVPARQILDEAKLASFIVLASHGRAGFRATFIGSVADKVVRGSTVPVLVVPAFGKPIEPSLMPMVVALDGSPEAECALTIARRLAEPAGGQLVLVRSYGLPRLRGADFEYFPAEMPDVLEKDATEYLYKVAEEGDEKIVVQSEPSDAILNAAKKHDAGLVVMATTGKGLAGRLALGSTTDRVLHSLHRPLLVVPESTSK
jgi:nucleotide-binding universal stress UspA family protein